MKEEINAEIHSKEYAKWKETFDRASDIVVNLEHELEINNAIIDFAAEKMDKALKDEAKKG